MIFTNKSRILLVFIILLYSIELIAQSKYQSYNELLENNKSLLTKEDLIRDKNGLKRYHPNPFRGITERKYDSILNIIAENLPLKPTFETEQVQIRRQLIDLVGKNDPHVRFIPKLTPKKGVRIKAKDILVPPCSFLFVNDTLLIDNPYTDLLKKGDQITSINGKNITEYIQTAYPDRYISSPYLMAYHHLSFSRVYEMVIKRGDEEMGLRLDGLSLTEVNYLDRQLTETVFDKYKTGYIKINNFEYNKFISKRFNQLTKKIEGKGYNNIIIDLRKNTGGNGEFLEKMFSIMCDKQCIDYQYACKLKVSKLTYKSYGLPTDSIGKLISLADDEYIKSIPLDKSVYLPKIDYYILISNKTASVAASFANIVQNNDFGVLVGESLLQNALLYGETIPGIRNNTRFNISTVEYMEHTKAENGILNPDISIPFVASEYMKGGDPVLEKCLEYIKNQSRK